MAPRDLTFYERNLPHRLPPGEVIFLTFRLADSLPHDVIMRLRAASGDLSRLADKDRYAQQRRYFGKFDELLDGASFGASWLRQPVVAQLVQAALHFSDQKHYNLLCYCIMPNHVHLVVSLSDEAVPLARTMQSLKGSTAYRANKLLNRTGQFWQRESYDHIVRDASELDRVIAYVINNPVKAGLVENWQDWPYTYRVP